MRGTSKDKFIKGTNIPKHAGNFAAYHTVCYWATKDYPVNIKDGLLIVGQNKRLSDIKTMPKEVEWLALNDPNFKQYRQEGEFTFNNKQYKVYATLTKSSFGLYGLTPFTYREAVQTKKEFEYKFPNY